jgi:hypothetical protein
MSDNGEFKSFGVEIALSAPKCKGKGKRPDPPEKSGFGELRHRAGSIPRIGQKRGQAAALLFVVFSRPS